jgi:hypothetical protein
MRLSSEALAKEDWSFGGLRRTAGATDSCPWGATSACPILKELEFSTGPVGGDLNALDWMLSHCASKYRVEGVKRGNFMGANSLKESEF